MEKTHIWRRSVALVAAVMMAATLTACSGGESTDGGSAGSEDTEAPGTSTDTTDEEHVATHIYWANNGIAKGDALMATNDTIGVATLDGTEVNQSLVSGIEYPSGLAAQGEYIYWTDVFTNSIGRAKLDGSEADNEFITEGVAFAVGVAVDDEYVYWANNGTLSIGRAKLDGTEIDEDFMQFEAGIRMPNAIAVDDDYIYWSNVASQIGRANIDGTDIDENFMINTGAQSGSILSPLPVGLTVDDDYIYWSNMSSNAIGRAELDGTGGEYTFISGADFPGGVAVDGEYIYWANNDGTIGRANLDGTDVNQSFITGADGPAGLVVW